MSEELLDHVHVIAGRTFLIGDVEQPMKCPRRAPMKRRWSVLNLHGERFGKLTVKHFYGWHPADGKRLWYCWCDCGGSILCRTGELRSKHSRSCGCGSKLPPPYRKREASSDGGVTLASAWFEHRIPSHQPPASDAS